MEQQEQYPMDAAARAAHIRRITERIEGKQMLIRKTIMGKRSDYSPRVILSDVKEQK